MKLIGIIFKRDNMISEDLNAKVDSPSNNIDKNLEELKLVNAGKIRNVYALNDKELLIEATDKISAYDIIWDKIEGKGEILTKSSEWWFKKTRHIIPNHFISLLDNQRTIVRRCKVIPIEFVVRGYITGSTNTSLWTHYSRGEREYCGIRFPDGLLKNQKLPTPIVTPTTKSTEHDIVISPKEILKKKIISKEQLEYIYSKSLELFDYGQSISKEKGLILVDTKYEFGVDVESSEILLIDELHTCDSSRYWKEKTYQTKFENGEEPERFDKDLIRIWLKENYEDPYSLNPDDIVVPKEIKERIRNAYFEFYETLTK